MSTISLEQIIYPIGKMPHPQEISADDRAAWIKDLEDLESNFRSTLKGMSEAQLDTPYRDGGWTPRQLVHHMADSHIHAYTRTKWTLTEHNPIIKAYNENLWAPMIDGKTADPEFSLQLLGGLHQRWVMVLKSLTEEDWKRCYFHDEYRKLVSLETMLSMYAWHSKHHVAQIAFLKERMGWG
jgi:hypothetical protein